MTLIDGKDKAFLGQLEILLSRGKAFLGQQGSPSHNSRGKAFLGHLESPSQQG
eukprot:gene19837-26528_t